MQEKNVDMLARHDEAELISLSESDTYGGTTWVCATVTLVSAAMCPTTKCTKDC